MGIGVSLILIAAGAILTFAVHATSGTFNLHTIGIILMVVGAVGAVKRSRKERPRGRGSPRPLFMSPRTTEIATCAARSGCRLTAHLEALALEQGRPHKLRLRSPNRPRTPSSLTMVVHGDQRFASGSGSSRPTVRRFCNIDRRRAQDVFHH